MSTGIDERLSLMPRAIDPTVTASNTQRMKMLAPLFAVATIVACEQATPAPRAPSPPPIGAVPVAAGPAAAVPVVATPVAEVPAPTDSLAGLGPVVDSDFVAAGLNDAMDTTAVVRVLGQPDSVRVGSTEVDETQYDVFFYPDLIVSVVAGGTIQHITLTSPRYATRRSLRVGDPAARVSELYGSPQPSYAGQMDFADADTAAAGMHVVRVTMSSGRVKNIYLGWLVD